MLHVLLMSFALTAVTPPPPPPSLAPIATPTPDPGQLIDTPTPSPSPSTGPVATPTPSGPRLTVSPVTLELNPAQQRTLDVSGGSAPLTATLDGKLVQIAVNDNATVVTITASQATGIDTLHLVDANGARADVPIRVAFNAGTIAAAATLKVTGAPVDGTWLVAQVKALVARLTQAMPGAQTTFGNPVPPVPTPMPAGAQMQFTVPVQIASTGGQYFDQTGSTVINVQNVPVDAFAPALLFYDDDPEHVSADGVLFRSTITGTQPARLYYYHDNAADPRRIVVVLSSTSQDPASVQIIDASAGPNNDVMGVGHAVTRNFLLTKPKGQGTILDLTGDEPYILKDVALTTQQGAAGNLDIRVISGGPVTATVMALSPGVDPRTLLAAPPLPDDGHHRTGVFALSGFGNDTLSFTAGGADASVSIGDRQPTAPNVDATAPGHDYGDYGVWHSIAIALSNPAPAPATAYLYFEPLVGIARSSFLVDGSLVEIGCVRVRTPYQIAAIPLAAGATQQVRLDTMTDGGSFYPVEIGVTGTPPQPGAPPISGPDGCFPKPGYTAPAVLPAPSAPAPVATASPAT
jgi:hypothetical protein